MPGIEMANRPPSMMSRPRTTSAARTTTLTGALFRCLRGPGICFDDDRRAIGDDLGHRRGHLAAVEAHRDDCVRPHERGVLDHPVDRLAAGVLEELGVLVDLAADDGPQARGEVAGQASAADDEAERLALRLDDSMARDEWCGGHDHERSSRD